MEDNVASALCYLLGWITGVLFLVLPPYNQNRVVRFHAFQSIFMNVAAFAVWMVVLVAGTVLSIIPIFGHMVAALLFPLVGLGFFALWIFMMFKAFNRERIVLPVIGPLAEKQV